MTTNLLIILSILSIQSFGQTKLDSLNKDYGAYLPNWVEVKSIDTLTIKVLEFIPNFNLCGDRTAETLTIGYIPRHDTIRILVLCEIDETK